MPRADRPEGDFEEDVTMIWDLLAYAALAALVLLLLFAIIEPGPLARHPRDRERSKPNAQQDEENSAR